LGKKKKGPGRGTGGLKPCGWIGKDLSSSLLLSAKVLDHNGKNRGEEMLEKEDMSKPGAGL